MPYDEFLKDRIAQNLRSVTNVVEKKMMGGLIFMINDKMCIGVDKDRKTNEDRIMCRIGPDAYDKYFGEPGTRPMDFTGKPMKGFIFVYADGIDMDEDLDKWVKRALAFNHEAKKSKGR